MGRLRQVGIWRLRWRRVIRHCGHLERSGGNEHHYHQKVNTLVLHDLSRDYSGRWVDGFYAVACWRFQRRRPFRHRCCLERNRESNVCGVSLHRPTVRAARAMGAAGRWMGRFRQVGIWRLRWRWAVRYCSHLERPRGHEHNYGQEVDGFGIHNETLELARWRMVEFHQMARRQISLNCSPSGVTGPSNLSAIIAVRYYRATT